MSMDAIESISDFPNIAYTEARSCSLKRKTFPFFDLTRRLWLNGCGRDWPCGLRKKSLKLFDGHLRHYGFFTENVPSPKPARLTLPFIVLPSVRSVTEDVSALAEADA